jgi:peptide chain release factor 2
MRERTHLEQSTSAVQTMEQELDDAVTLIDLGEAEDDQDSLDEAQASLAALRDQTAKRELESLLSGEVDSNDCFLEINAGAGGTESQDWTQMLARMYVRWAEAHDYKVEWLEESAGEEAGLKSATIKIIGFNAYGWLKTESGVHRLVRISPYDSAARRHTSFSSVWVYPVIDDTIDVQYEEKDLRIDTYRASGAGVSMSIKPTAPFGLPIFRPGSSCSARMTGRNIATGRRPSACCVRVFTNVSFKCVRRLHRPSMTPRPTSAGDIRFDPMCCSPIKW